MAATPGEGESHVGDGVEVDEVSEELIVVEVEDSSDDVEVTTSKEVEDEKSLDVVIEVEDSSEDVDVTTSEKEVEEEESLDVVAVACSSSRSSASAVEVIKYDVDVATVSVVVD